MRYSRQEIFLRQKYKEFNLSKIHKNVVVIGCGGVGSVLIELLAKSGFSDVKVIDNDLVDETNLGRQIFEENDLGTPKTKAIKKRISKINSSKKYEFLIDLITQSNISKFLNKSDLIVDATDNFETRKIINKYCEENNKNWLYCGAVKSEIICCLFFGKDKKFKKVFPNNIVNESCCDVGVLPSTTFSAASLALNQIIKYFLDNKYKPELIKQDLWNNKIHVVKI